MFFIKAIRDKLIALTFFLITLPAWAVDDPDSIPSTTSALHSQLFSPINTASNLVNMLIEGAVKYSFQVFAGVIILTVGWFLAKFVSRVFHKFLIKHKVDVTVAKFLVNAVSLAIIIFAALLALGKFGIEIAPFVAGLSVVGFGTSFALQGPLSNYAAGISLIFTKPFKVGDIMEVANVMGEVQDISLSQTKIITVDGTIIFIPNKHIIGEIIHNYTEFKRLTLKIGIGYNSDVDKAIQMMADVVARDVRVAKKRKTKAGISEFQDSTIILSASLWCKQSDYEELLYDLNKDLFHEFVKNKIEIPYPQRVVHLKKGESI